MNSWVLQNFAGDSPSLRWRRFFISLLALATIMICCGYAVLVLDLLPDRYGWFGSVILFLGALLVVVSEGRSRGNVEVLGEALMIGVGTVVLEFMGMHTGFPFGEYSYTDVLGFRVAGVPLAIGAAWYTTILCTRRIVQSATSQPLRTALLAALLTVAFDIALEPMAWHVARYWQWHSEYIPLQNYASWFLISFIVVAVLEYREKSAYRAPTDPMRRTAALVLMLQMGLFITVNLANGFVREVLISTLMLGVILVRVDREHPFFAMRKANAS